jgi:hypothetical protein
MCLLAETVSDLELRDPAAVLYTRLAPFAPNLPTVPPLSGKSDTTHSAVWRPSSGATVTPTRTSAPPPTSTPNIHARYLLAWAEMLARRANDRDPDHACDLAHQAGTIATQSGYGGVELRASTLLDLTARLAGMTLRERWSDWKRGPSTSDSRQHVSVWDRTSERSTRDCTASRREA